MDGICAAGDEVELWLKTHGGWFPDPQQDYGYGSVMPAADGPDVMSKEPEKATKEAKGVMSILAEFLGDGVAELMVRSDLKGLAQKWLDDLEEQAPASSSTLTEANVEAHEFRLEFAHETLQSFKDRKGQRDRSRSPRRNVVPDMMIATMKETISALEQMIRAKDEIIHKMKMDHMGEKTRLEVKNIENNTRITILEMQLSEANSVLEIYKTGVANLIR